MAKPHGVFAAAPYKKGALLLVPATTRVLCKPVTAPVSVWDVRGDAAPDNMVMELQSGNSKTCTAPAWMVKHLKESKESTTSTTKATEKSANMEIVHKQVTVKLSRGKGKASKTNDIDEYLVEIPCLLNSKDLKINDELWLPPLPSTKRPAQSALNFQPCSKVLRAK
jgi:hypothetical protein